jgi:hypothetical protein
MYDRLSWSVPALFPTPGRFDKLMLRFVVAGAFATLLAFVSRRYFEEKFLRMKERFGA